MYIEVNNKIEDIGKKDVQRLAERRYGKAFNIEERPLLFKLSFALLGEDEDGRILTPKKFGILPYVSVVDEDGNIKNIHYYTSKTGTRDKEIYNPQSIYFVEGELTLDLTAERGGLPDYALAYLLFQHPKLMKDSNINQPGQFYLYRADEEAASELESEALRAEVDTYLLYKNGRDYIKDEELESSCRKLGIPVTGFLSKPELRKMLLTKARINPKDFVIKIKRDGKFTEKIQQALDMKIIGYNETTGEYSYIYRPDDGIFNRKKWNSTSFYRVPPHGRQQPLKSLVDFLVNEDTDGNFANIEAGLDDEVRMLKSHPQRPAGKDENKAIMKMVADIVVE